MKMINNNTERRDLQLNCMLSVGLWVLLQDHCRKTNEPVSHIVSLALADYFQVSHSTLYQVSTATALVEGIYQGAVRVRTLREHGDLGLGTFENLDGEMVVVDYSCSGSNVHFRVERLSEPPSLVSEISRIYSEDLLNDTSNELAQGEQIQKRRNFK